jgi:hypothetical protein
MPWYVYSSEELPNSQMMGKPRYSPDGEYIRWNSITMRVIDEQGRESCIIPKGRWAQVVEVQTTKRRRDWRSPAEEVDVPASKFKPIVDSRFGERGVVMLNHEPSEAERKHLEAVSATTNMGFRRRAVEFFESQRKSAEGRQGTYEPTPYIDECYEVLGMRKPYSMEALRAQRDPGREAAIDIANAMKQGQEETARMVADAVADVLTRPREQTVPARR